MMVMRKGENQSEKNLKEYAKFNLPTGTKVKTNTPGSKGAWYVLPDGIIFAAETSNHKLLEKVTDPNFETKERYPTLLDVPRKINIKDHAERMMTMGLCYLKEAVEFSGEKNLKVILDEEGIPRKIKTNISEYDYHGRKE